MIPEAAVEAAARAWCGPGDLRDWQRRHITKLLEAAAPHMLPEPKYGPELTRPQYVRAKQAEALREASAAYPLETAYGGAEHAVQWLKARAEHIGKHHTPESE